MASMKVIIADDGTSEMEVSGGLMDIVSIISYIIGKVYYSINTQNCAAGFVMQEMLAKAISDPNSPVWHITPSDEDIGLCVVAPKCKDD